jgi:hypothetical protein
MKLRLSIRDRAFAHSPVSNGPTPALQYVNSPIEWDRESPATPDTIYTDAEIAGAPAGVRVWLIEPMKPDAYNMILRRAHEFREVWTHDRSLLAMIPNGRFVPLGGCWIAPEDRRIWPKTKGISTIASAKHGGEGYDMRHAAIALFTQIDPFGPEYRPLAHKIEALRDYRFQLVIENVRADWWFTEKLIDCFATGTVPIYWGCPSIDRYFNPWGMLRAKNLDDAELMVAALLEETYNFMLPAIRDNFERAKSFYLAEDWIARNILS